MAGVAGASGVRDGRSARRGLSSRVSMSPAAEARGGVLGRADDMMIIRGVNVFPTAVEQILHGFPEVTEYRLIARKRGELDELAIEVEDHLNEPRRISRELQLRLGLTVEVQVVAPLSLPRFEGKGRRFVDERMR